MKILTIILAIMMCLALTGCTCNSNKTKTIEERYPNLVKTLEPPTELVPNDGPDIPQKGANNT